MGSRLYKPDYGLQFEGENGWQKGKRMCAIAQNRERERGESVVKGFKLAKPGQS